MILKSEYRFPACAKPRHRFVVSLMLRRAKAGRERSCTNKKLERDDDSMKSHLALVGRAAFGRSKAVEMTAVHGFSPTRRSGYNREIVQRIAAEIEHAAAKPC